MRDFVLIDDIELVFDRIFNSHNVFFNRIQMVQRAVQRCGFAAAGGPGHENQPVAHAEQSYESGREIVVDHAEPGQVEYGL